MLQVAIIEDNPVSADLLREYIDGDGIRVSDAYATGEDALEAIPRRPLPDIVLADVGLPGISGIEVTRRLKSLYPDLDIIIQTVFEDTETILASIRAGASGYMLKASSREDIRRALREVRAGGSPLSGKVAKKVFEEFKGTRLEAKPAGPNPKACADAYDLTEREKQILEYLIKGASSKEIAFDLGISVHTVTNHLRRVYEKLRVNSRGEAVAKAYQVGTAAASGDATST
jgi:DNA-binding NarL/FixJ family response regulator